MSTTFPESSILTESLSKIIGQKDDVLEILSRELFPESSTFPVEIISCRKADGTVLRLFGKYLGGKGPNNFGHRGGVEYEAKVYIELLSRTPLSTTHCYGKCHFAESGETLLVLEYLGEYLQFTKSDDPQSLNKAAAWIGTFHAMHEGNKPSFMTVYTHDYYAHWANRLKRLTKGYGPEHNWLRELADFYLDHIEVMTEGPQTIIHGEYYPKNVLMKGELIYPVDWESAAVAPGEIDFATLTEGWDPEPLAEATEAYLASRWPEGQYSIRDFEARLLMARIYMYFWWWPQQMTPERWTNDKFRFLQAKELATEAGVI